MQALMGLYLFVSLSFALVSTPQKNLCLNLTPKIYSLKICIFLRSVPNRTLGKCSFEIFHQKFKFFTVKRDENDEMTFYELPFSTFLDEKKKEKSFMTEENSENKKRKEIFRKKKFSISVFE
jgi:hypothetical protein